MADKKTIVEDTLLKMRNLEELLQENAKGILASTMKEEISELVKESLTETNEQEEEDIEVGLETPTDELGSEDDVDLDMDQTLSDVDTDDEEEADAEEEGMSLNVDMDTEDEIPMDLTGASDEELLKVFKAMGEDDNIIVKKDDDQIKLTDDTEDVEYLIDLGESEEETEEKDSMNELHDDESEEEEVEFNFDDENEEETFKPMRKAHKLRKMRKFDEAEEGEDEVVDATIDPDLEGGDKQAEIDRILDTVFAESEEEEEEEEETIYEIELDDDDTEEDTEEMDESSIMEAFKAKMFKGKQPEAKSNKGPKSLKTMKSTMKKPTGKMFGMTPKVGKMGKKVEAKEGDENMEKIETKEAARTLGTGKKFGKKGLPKTATAPRHLNVESIDVEAMNTELNSLREKNEEYRKALNIFREKLNEVAVFNSNLAYATRLFTEHSTSKQEKINILRRFDGVESIKESKSLYSTIREELTSKSSAPITESIENKIEKTPSSGSAVNLIESKTYENPQFLRMKDLMSKIK